MLLDRGVVQLDTGPAVRLDVFTDDFDRLMQAHEGVPIQNIGGRTPCLQGSARHGMTRQHVRIPLFDHVVARLEQG
jgi:hypothetical protein